MSESWDQYAGDWDTNADVIHYADKAFDTLCEIVNLEGLTVLDFGCGTGLLAERMAAKVGRIAGRIVCIDSSEKMIEVLQNKQLKNVETWAGELTEEALESNPIFNSKFDLVVASSVCAFLPDYEGTLTLLKQALKPKGVFIQWDWLKTSDDSDFGFTDKTIETALINSGMEVVKVETAFAMESSKGTMPVIMAVASNA